MCLFSYLWDSAPHLEAFSLGFESGAGVFELVLAICFARTVFALRTEPTEEIKRRKERLEAALGLVAGIFFIVAIAACWRILILSKNERIESSRQLNAMANDLAAAKQTANEARNTAEQVKWRAFSEQQKRLAKETLVVYSGTSVDISSAIDDSGSEDFARRLNDLLNSCGWKSSEGGRGMFPGEPHGVNITVNRMADAPAASSLLAFLDNCEITATGFNPDKWKGSEWKGSDISIVIGPK
jgi:hypothetical protein